MSKSSDQTCMDLGRTQACRCRNSISMTFIVPADAPIGGIHAAERSLHGQMPQSISESHHGRARCRWSVYPQGHAESRDVHEGEP